MTPGKLDPAVVADRASWIRNMLAGIQELPLSSLEAFTRDRHVTAAAESYLRRAIEGLVDLGRHILAKRFAVAVTEYRAIPAALEAAGVIGAAHVPMFTRICGYRNRMVHFYHRISDDELYNICKESTDDIEELLDRMLGWIDTHWEEG